MFIYRRLVGEGVDIKTPRRCGVDKAHRNDRTPPTKRIVQQNAPQLSGCGSGGAVPGSTGGIIVECR
jgi:hypothetical protein